MQCTPGRIGEPISVGDASATGDCDGDRRAVPVSIVIHDHQLDLVGPCRPERMLHLFATGTAPVVEPPAVLTDIAIRVGRAGRIERHLERGASLRRCRLDASRRRLVRRRWS